MEYDLTIQYIKGETNNIADYLSRESFMAVEAKEDLYEDVFPSETYLPYHIDKFIDYYNDKEKEVISFDGKMMTCTGVRVYVPELLREKLLTVFHNHPLLGGHLGYDKINGKFKIIFYWSKMDDQMKDVWISCLSCQLNIEQPSRLIETHKTSLQQPSEIWHTVNADFMQVVNEYIFVMIDEYSKYVVATCCKKQNDPTLLHILLKCFSLLGFPKILRSDNGPAFIAKTVTDYMKSVAVEQQISSPNNHKSNAIVERFNRTLRSAIRIYKEQSLIMVVSHFVYAYNRSKSLSKGLSPAQIVLNTLDRSVTDDNIHNGYSGIHQLIKNTKSQFKEDKIDRKGLQLKLEDLVLRRVMHRKDAKTSHKNQPSWKASSECSDVCTKTPMRLKI